MTGTVASPGQRQGPLDGGAVQTAGWPRPRSRQDTWGAGDYESIVQRLGLGQVGPRLVTRVGVSTGMTVLDMASGTGSVARAAASAGGLVWGLDLTWDMLAQADRAPTDPGHCVRWVQGDAMTLPFADGSFDRVLSSMGVMFVGDDRRAAQELARVCRGRGVIGLCSWTPEGVPGLVGRTVASFLSGGNATDDAGPMRWGTEEHVRRLFGGCGVEFERTGVPAQTESAAAYIRLLAGSAGPLVACRRVLSGQGRWEAFCDHLVALLEARNETPGTGWRADQEYLVAVIRPRDAGPAG